VDAVIPYQSDQLILIRRKNPPFQGQFALPGGFVDIGETVERACIRETKEETNLEVSIQKLVGVFSDPKRDPRGHTVTVAFLCEVHSDSPPPKAQDDAAALEIVPLKKVTTLQLAFDHKKILQQAGFL